MAPNKTASWFQTTSWTLIEKAKVDPAALEVLLERYRPPVYAYLCKAKRVQPADADDLVQAFMCEVVLGRDLISRAKKDNGRFRSLLLSCLGRFVTDQYRHEHGRNGEGRPKFVPLDPQMLDAVAANESDDPAMAYNDAYAATTLDVTLARVEADCRRRRMQRQWEAFEARVLRPNKYGCQPAPYEELMQSLGERDPQKIYTMVDTIKDKLRREFLRVVAEGVSDPGEVDEEVAQLTRLLKR
ncbi:MAG: hypothetical protein O6768_07740 [Planctomycetota bacterium]|nr:hypothetical protein [Planctomycetota bacterium]